MKRVFFVRILNCAILAAVLCVGLFLHARVSAVEIVLDDGRAYIGREGMLPKFGDIQAYADMNAQMVPMSIVFIDDDLRRTYVPKRRVVDVPMREEANILPEKFNLRQQISGKGGAVRNMGLILKAEPFDQFGRRTIQVATTSGPLELVQCITELAPQWTRLECTKYVWDMRIATSSISSEELLPILRHQSLRLCKGDETEAALKIARFFIQGERYDMAAYELNRILQTAAPEKRAELEAALSPTFMRVRQLAAQRALAELVLREENGQFVLVRRMLENFPSDEVAGETLQKVRDMLDAHAQREKRIETLIEQIQIVWKSLKEEDIRAALKPVLVEILENVNENTIARMEAFENIMDVSGIPAEEKAALVVTCWLMGSRRASDRITQAVSAVKTRALICEYMEAQSELSRETIFERFRSEEAARVETVAAIIAHMKPPVPLKKEHWLGKDGFFKLQTESSIDQVPVDYWVQVPLEYDPHRLYPVIVCLNGMMDSPEKELEWWTGGFNPKGFRYGQAGRHGYIIIAPQWQKNGQREYEYSAREHAAVLNALHDASRYFAIDTDRVFLSGHFEGGDAAWDIGLAHPDLWAGVVLFSCRAKKYAVSYWQNAQLLPIYYICGELDNSILGENSGSLSQYMVRAFDATCVEFLGRGREPFFDEVHRIFDWMKRKKRNFYPEKFQVRTLRQCDNFFWWVELDDIPENNLVAAHEFPPRNMPTGKIIAELIPKANTLKLSSIKARVSLWMGPGMLDYNAPINVLVNGKNIAPREGLRPSLRVLLEDVRRRGDRQNPFWLKIQADLRRAK
ncbi:MAG: hypothetical protein Q4D38_01295 [Planctomycetia bacterium]|nr:hypothetical protein [Planctomycetia bacterium]